MLKKIKIIGDNVTEIDIVEKAIERLRAFEPTEGYWLAFSGGKDSVVIKKLAEMAGVKFEAHYMCTSVDPPELVRFVKAQKDVYFDIPKDKDGKRISMWSLIANRSLPPTRLMRYCCADLKEAAGKGRVTITGVRWAESVNRSKKQGLVNIQHKDISKRIIHNDDNDEARRMVEQCYRTRKTLINPIIDWTDDDVWDFIKKYNVPYCELYDKGFKRLGCIGCPMNNKRKYELAILYPKYKNLYLKAFKKMLENRKKREMKTQWKDEYDVYKWWVDDNKKDDDMQMKFFEDE